jgi:hypothetical protein
MALSAPSVSTTATSSIVLQATTNVQLKSSTVLLGLGTAAQSLTPPSSSSNGTAFSVQGQQTTGASTLGGNLELRGGSSSSGTGGNVLIEGGQSSVVGGQVLIGSTSSQTSGITVGNSNISTTVLGTLVVSGKLKYGSGVPSMSSQFWEGAVSLASGGSAIITTFVKATPLVGMMGSIFEAPSTWYDIFDSTNSGYSIDIATTSSTNIRVTISDVSASGLGRNCYIRLLMFKYDP